MTTMLRVHVYWSDNYYVCIIGTLQALKADLQKGTHTL